MVPEFLSGWPMHSREPLQHQESTNGKSQDTVLETTNQTTPSDFINYLAEVLAGMNNCSSAQTLIVRPDSTAKARE